MDETNLYVGAAMTDVIWHRKGGGHARGDERATEIGEAIADIVVSAFQEGKRKAVERVDMLSDVMEIPDRVWEDSTFCRDDSRGDTEAARERARFRYDPEEAAVKARGHTVCPVEIMGIGFGDTAVVTNPAELFVKLGMEIKRRSPFGVTLVSELTNGYCGYVGDIDDFVQQGYETHRTLYTCRLAKDGARRIVELSMAMLGQLHNPI